MTSRDIRPIAEAEEYKAVPPNGFKWGPDLLLYTPWLGWRTGCWDTDHTARRPRPYWMFHGCQTMESRMNQPTHFMVLPEHPEGLAGPADG